MISWILFLISRRGRPQLLVGLFTHQRPPTLVPRPTVHSRERRVENVGACGLGINKYGSHCSGFRNKQRLRLGYEVAQDIETIRVVRDWSIIYALNRPMKDRVKVN